jgi:type I restriction enzyme S subunit
VTWERRRLTDVAELSLGKMLDQKKNRGTLRPYLANINVRWGAFDLANLREMRFEPHESERYGVRDGDIVMCEGGEPGRCAIWREQVPDVMIQKALHRIRPKAGLDHRFLF